METIQAAEIITVPATETMQAVEITTVPAAKTMQAETTKTVETTILADATRAAEITTQAADLPVLLFHLIIPAVPYAAQVLPDLWVPSGLPVLQGLRVLPVLQ